MTFNKLSSNSVIFRFNISLLSNSKSFIPTNLIVIDFLENENNIKFSLKDNEDNYSTINLPKDENIFLDSESNLVYSLNSSLNRNIIKNLIKELYLENQIKMKPFLEKNISYKVLLAYL